MRRNRTCLDQPEMLLTRLLCTKGPRVNVSKLVAFIDANSQAAKTEPDDNKAEVLAFIATLTPAQCILALKRWSDWHYGEPVPTLA